MLLYDFSVVVGREVEGRENDVEILPYDIFTQSKPFKGTKFLRAELDSAGRGLLLTLFEAQLRKFNGDHQENEARDNRFIIDKDLFERLNPALFEIDYQMLPDGKFEIVSVPAEVAR